MPFRENLPNDCPPPEAVEVDEPTPFFRLIDRFPPTDSNFDSVWKIQPGRRPNLGKDECKAKGLSIYSSPAAAQEQTQHPTLKGKVPCQVTVTPGAPSHARAWPPFYLVAVQRLQNLVQPMGSILWEGLQQSAPRCWHQWRKQWEQQRR